jgi:hypothetical protein
MRKLTSGLLVLIGALWSFRVLPIAAKSGQAYFRTGSAPLPAKVAGAPDERWIRLVDGRLRCETRSVQKRFTYFLADSSEGGSPFVAQLSGDVPCEGASLEGGFIPGRYSRAWLKENLGLDVPAEGELRVFSQALSPSYLRGVFAVSVALLLGGLAVLATGLRKLRRALVQPAAPAPR